MKNRTCDLPAGSAASQPTAPPPVPSLFQCDWNARVRSIKLEFQKVNGTPDSIMSYRLAARTWQMQTRNSQKQPVYDVVETRKA